MGHRAASTSGRPPPNTNSTVICLRRREAQETYSSREAHRVYRGDTSSCRSVRGASLTWVAGDSSSRAFHALRSRPERCQIAGTFYYEAHCSSRSCSNNDTVPSQQRIQTVLYPYSTVQASTRHPPPQEIQAMRLAAAERATDLCVVQLLLISIQVPLASHGLRK
jgi:hypothetical protein